MVSRGAAKVDRIPGGQQGERLERSFASDTWNEWNRSSKATLFISIGDPSDAVVGQLQRWRAVRRSG
jgi:hypothetical protein